MTTLYRFWPSLSPLTLHHRRTTQTQGPPTPQSNGEPNVADELTPQQETELLDALRTLEQDLVTSLSETKEQTQPVDLDLPIGRLSRMDAIQQKNMAQANRRSAEVRLKQVRAAISKCNQELYGWCGICEGPIGYPRLKARPETPFCLECQSQREKR